jgi:hypothetical protein
MWKRQVIHRLADDKLGAHAFVTTWQKSHRPFIYNVSNFDWTDCLAGCEEKWGPGGREVDGRRVILWDPSMVLIQTQQEARGRWKYILI